MPMESWVPATQAEVERQLAAELASIHPAHRDRFESIRVPVRAMAIDSHPGERVLVVAEHEGAVIYWSDVEGGWERDLVTESGAIPTRGSSQLELGHLMWQLFGDPGSLQ